MWNCLKHCLISVVKFFRFFLKFLSSFNNREPVFGETMQIKLCKWVSCIHKSFAFFKLMIRQKVPVSYFDKTEEVLVFFFWTEVQGGTHKHSQLAVSIGYIQLSFHPQLMWSQSMTLLKLKFSVSVFLFKVKLITNWEPVYF